MLKRVKDNYKPVLAAGIGGVIVLALVISIIVKTIMGVDGNADYEAYVKNVKAELVALENKGTPVKMPFTTEELDKGSQKEYSIESPMDFMALMVLSYENSLEGYTFYVQKSETGYNLKEVVIGENTYAFKGIGLNPSFPFKGNLSSTLGGGGIGLELSSPLFGYLDASARINNSNSQDDVVFSLDVEEAPSGLALALTGSGVVDSTTVKNINLSGTVKNQYGCAGSIFGEIIGSEETPLEVKSLGISSDISAVSGICTGGLFGKVVGNVKLTIEENLWKDSLSVIFIPDYSVQDLTYATGGLIGEILGKENQKPEIILSGNIGIEKSSLAGAIYTGGIVGKAVGCSFTIDSLKLGADGKTLNISNNGGVVGDSFSGGFAGYLEDVNINSSNQLAIRTSGYAGYIGGFAGKIKDSIISLNNITFAGNVSDGRCAGGLIGNSEGSNITADTLVVGDAFVIQGNAVAAGGVIGQDTNSKYIISNISYNGKGIKVSSSSEECSVGGFAGSLDSTKLNITNGIETSGTTVTAESKSASSDRKIFVGGIIGKYVNNTDEDVTLSEYKVDGLTIYAKLESQYSYIGGIIGVIENGEGAGKVNLSQCSAYNYNVYPVEDRAYEGRYKMYMGGILGGNFVKGAEISNVTAQVTTGNKNEKRNVYGYGGVVGLAAADCNISRAYDLVNSTYDTSNIVFARINGGVIGEISPSVAVDVEDVTFLRGRLSHRYADLSTVAGGVAGKTGEGSVLCLKGTVDLSKIKPVGQRNSSKYYGSIVGEQNNSLLYMEPVSYSAETGYSYGFSVSQFGFADEVGNYGSVYRNGNWDSNAPAADLNDKSDWIIVRNGDITSVKQDSEPYKLSTAGDAMRLSIALNTENVFAPFESSVTCENLLKGTYTLGADIDLSNTGIQTLNKNQVNSAKKVDQKYWFAGSLTGTDKYTIKNSVSAVNQGYLGLFSAVGDNASFSNFKLDTTISYYYNVEGKPHLVAYTDAVCGSAALEGSQHFGGITAYAEGNVTIDNVDLNVNASEGRAQVIRNHYLMDLYFGGAIGQYVTGNGKNLTMKNIAANVNLTISEKNHYAGGLVGFVNNDVANGTVSAEKITVSGNIKSIFHDQDGNNNGIDYARVGGVIASIGMDSVTDENAVDVKTTVKLNDITIEGLVVGDELQSKVSRAFQCGGMIGYQWKNVEVKGTDIKINKSGDSASGIIPVYHLSGTSYGGLWHTAWGHMSLEKVALNGMNINIPGSTRTNRNGLLVGNGQYLYLELKDYTIDKAGTTVSDASALYLDEIVGCNKGTGGDFSKDSGGVVSIKNETGYGLYQNVITDQINPGTRYYYNLDEDLKDVSKLSDNTVNIDSVAKMLQWSLAHHVNTPLRQFFNIEKGYVKEQENVTFTGTLDLGDASYYPVSVTGGTYKGSNGNIVFHGKTFDTNVTEWKNTNPASASHLRYPYEENSEHYRLQSGLFCDVTQADISKLNLKGSVTAVEKNGGMYSGALVCGTILGVELETEEGSEYINYSQVPTNITEIVLDNLVVSNVKADGWHGNYGLLVGAVGSGAKVHFGPEDVTKDTAGVSMIHYNSCTDKAAAALIGTVGSETAQGMNITFTNMKIADVADSVTDGALVGRDNAGAADEKMDLTGAKVMAHASFIYNCQYMLDNTTGVYIFYLDDYKNQNVTLGEEIGTTVQFYDAELVQPIYDYTADSSKGCLPYQASHYKPYVYQTKKIDVNPKNGHILKGCGTYDDPYVIETANQFMTLYYYLSDYNRYKNTLLDWEINEFGTDAVNGDEPVVEKRTYNVKHYNIGLKKDADDKETEENSTYKTLTESGFPSIEQLSNAYYMITKDIDISGEDDFTGFGTEDLPFTGVFVGNYIDNNGQEDNTKQCQVLMASTPADGASRYGFIKYAKGAVVRNLHLNLGSDAVRLVYNGTGAGVMAAVTGGDNIIDKVKVSGSIQALSLKQSNNNASYTILGGYVGDLQKGSVILREYEADALSSFTIKRQGADIDEAGTYQKGMIGKIQDGFVVDDGIKNISAVYQANPAKTINSGAPSGASLAATDTINVADLDNSAGLSGQISDEIAILDKNDKITVSQSEDNGYQYGLNSGQDLLVLSFAINSGSMNYWGNEKTGTSDNVLTAGIYGYDRFSRCRIQDYSYVGKVGSSQEGKEAYLNVIRYDNGNPYTKDSKKGYICSGKNYGESFYKPFIFNFFDFEGQVEVLKGTGYDSRSNMNQQYTVIHGNKKYLSTYNLAAGTYDMSQLSIKKCFKGIGAKTAYGVGNNTIFCSLQGNFKGAGSSYSDKGTSTTIKLDMDFTKTKDVALFQVLYSGTTVDSCKYEISGFNITGNVKNTMVKKGENIMAAGIAPRVFGAYTFQDILAENLLVDATVTPDTQNGINPETTTAAAFIARGDYSSNENYSQKNTISFTNCGIYDSTIRAWDDCGGFFAVNVTNSNGNSFENCRVVRSTLYSNRGNLGGFAGYEKYGISFKNCELESSTITREYVEAVSTIKTTNIAQGVGGFLGYISASNKETSFDNCRITGTADKPVCVEIVMYHVEYYKPVGGFIGMAEDWSGAGIQFENCNIEKLKIKQCTPSDAGGFVGQSSKSLLINQKEGATSTVTDLEIERYFQNCTGGIVGRQSSSNEKSSSISNVTITGFTIQQQWEYTCYTGGIVGSHQLGKLEITNVHVKGTKEHPVSFRYNVGTYYDTSLKLYTGGIVGYSGDSTDCVLTLDNCSFEGEENTEGVSYASIINSHYSGGLVGFYRSKNTLTIKNSAVKNAAIQAVCTRQDNNTETPHGAAAGVVAKLDTTGGTQEENGVIENVEVTNVTLLHYDEEFSGATTDDEKEKLANTNKRTIAMGGIAGVVVRGLDIRDFKISGLIAGADGYGGEAGGVVGMAIDAPLTIDVTSMENNSINNSRIIAGVAGGIIGNTQRKDTKSTVNTGVTVKNIVAEDITVLAKNYYGNGWDLYAGGITGRHEIIDMYSGTTVPNNADVHIYENVTLKDSLVSSYRNNIDRCEKTYLGGFVGGQLENENQSAGIVLQNVLMGHLKFNDAASQGVIPSYENVQEGTVSLYTIVCSNTNGNLKYNQEALTAGSNCVAPKYALNTGLWFGRIRNIGNSYVIKAKTSHKDNQAQFHPGSDTGVSAEQMSNLLADENVTMDEVYKLYNDKVHILYTEDFVTVSDNSGLIGEKLGLSDYVFSQLDAIYSSRFAGHIVDSNCDYRLDYNYKQNNSEGNVNYKVSEVLDASYKSVNGYLSPYEWNGKKIPMLVSAGKYDINTVINTAINVLTNNGGATNGICEAEAKLTSDKLLEVNIQRVKYQPDIENDLFVIADDGKEVIRYDKIKGVFSISGVNYDSVEEKTFNLVTVKYRHSDQKVYTLQLPVFVRETVKITTHMKGMEGSGYVVADIPKSDVEPAKGYTEINVELNNVYSLYSEFIYSSAREEYTEIKLSKSLYRTFEDEETIRPFDIGTRITMLDISDKNKVYFYEVTAENQNQNNGRIYFSDFKAMDSNTYLVKDVSDKTAYPVYDVYEDICNQKGTFHTDVGVEQFIFIIDESQINATTSTIYDLYIRAEEADNVELFKNAVLNTPCFVRVNEIPKLHKVVSGSSKYEAIRNKITLSGKTGTTIAEDSKISRDSTLGVTGTTYIMSPSTIDQSLPDYWKFVANSTKKQYLELAISIEDVNGTRVAVPDGTMVSVTLGGVDYGTIVANNSEYIYCYYDTQNGKPNPSHLDLNTCNKDLSVDFDVLFDFSSATDFSGIKDTSYQITVEVLDTSDKDYPRNGSQCDKITVGTVQGINHCVLGFALETEEILTLGMNGYNSESSDEGKINFKSRLDFSDYLDSGEEGIRLLKEEFEGKYFTYTYVLERKNTSGNYEIFGYEPENRYDSLMKLVAGQNIDSWEDIPKQDQDTEKLVLVEKTVQYTLDVEKTASGEGVKNEISLANPIMEESYTLFANVEELLKTPKNITNYKLTCYVSVTDSEPAESATIDVSAVKLNSKVDDFFIVTLAKLKTDME